MSHRTLIIVLAAATAICELFGTGTVWRTVNRTAEVARRVQGHLNRDETQHHEEISDVMLQLAKRNASNVAHDVDQLRFHQREFLGQVIRSLDADTITKLGLASFFAGAVLGFITVVIAI